LYRFLAITVLLDAKDIPQVGPLQWGWITSTLDSIEQALNRHGVIPFSTPTPGVRCSN